MGDFDELQTTSLLLQHTEETGQRWSRDALREMWESTQGQPWLVNALANEACETVRGQCRQIGHEDVIESREVLIRRRDTHLDQLADKLREPRVKRVIEPLLSGDPDAVAYQTDDIQYVCDLGLIRQGPPIQVANPIYREIIPRELINSLDKAIPYETAWFVEDGRLVMDRLMESFQEFFRGHSEHWVQKFDFQEAGPQLLLQAFLQRIVNAGGRVEREYAAGSMRTDLLVVWHVGEVRQRVVIECKLRRRVLILLNWDAESTKWDKPTFHCFGGDPFQRSQCRYLTVFSSLCQCVVVRACEQHLWKNRTAECFSTLTSAVWSFPSGLVMGGW